MNLVEIHCYYRFDFKSLYKKKANVINSIVEISVIIYKSLGTLMPYVVLQMLRSPETSLS